MCPALGTYAVIAYPSDGSNNVPTPTPDPLANIHPNTLDGRGIYLSDEHGNVVELDRYNNSCAGTDGDWVTSCYDLRPRQVVHVADNLDHVLRRERAARERERAHSASRLSRD